MSEVKINKESGENKRMIKSAGEKKYNLGDLRKNCLELFNVSTSVFDGAVMGLVGKYTISEIKNIITKWKDKEVL